MHSSTVTNSTAQNNTTAHHEEYTADSVRFSANGDVHIEHAENYSHNNTVPNGTSQNNNTPHREVHTSNPARASSLLNTPANNIHRDRPDRTIRNNARHDRPSAAVEQQEEMQLYTPDDIMRIMRLSKSSAYKLFKSGDFPAMSHSVTRSSEYSRP